MIHENIITPYEGRELILNAPNSGIFPLKPTKVTEIKILTRKQIFQKFPKALAQVNQILVSTIIGKK